MLNRWIEASLLDVLDECGIGSIVFSPLAQGMLTDRYLRGIPVGIHPSEGLPTVTLSAFVAERLPVLFSFTPYLSRRIDASGQVVGGVSAVIRLFQSGSVKTYAAFLFLGAVMILAYYIWR